MTESKTRLSRRKFLYAGVAGVGAVATAMWWRSQKKDPYIPSIDTGPGLALLKKYPAIDVHSHPGRSFLANGSFDSLAISSMDSGFEAQRIADMQAGHVTASLFSLVADVKVLGLSMTKGVVAEREFEPGEAYSDFNRQLGYFQSLEKQGTLAFARSADQVRDAHAAGKSVAVLASEGADFVEDKLERLSIAYDAGMRSITLIHYRPSEYGDIQTAAPVHGGLTDLGAEVIVEMNRLGFVVDMAHAQFETVKDVVDRSTAPIMISHSHLSGEGTDHPRLISYEHADLVRQNGGIIGSWPAGITSQTMSDFVDETFRLIDAVGADHVAIGTDLDANYKPVLTDYVQFPEFATMLLNRGLSEEEAAKVLGLNFLRVFDAATAARQT